MPNPSQVSNPSQGLNSSQGSNRTVRTPTDHEFTTFFTTRRDHCHKLLELSRRQMELINQDDYNQLLAVLGQKQRILTQLDDLKKQHRRPLEFWQHNRDQLDATLRDDCQHLLAETEAVIAQLLEEETASTRHLTDRRDATQKQLQAISQGTQVHRAYRDSLAPSTRRHLDVDQ